MTSTDSPSPALDDDRSGPRPVAPAPSREAFFDNARIVMLSLVVVGHAIEPWLGHDRGLRAAYLALYAFHMPVFVWLAGRFVSEELTRPRAVRLVERVLAPLLVFQVLYSVFHHLAFGTPHLDLGFVRPYWIMWFLMSLLWWRLLLPILAVVPGNLLLSVALAAAAGLSNAVGYDLSLSRTLVFLPFFLFGYRMRRSDLAFLSTRWARAGSVAVLASLAIAAWRFAPHLDERWLYGSLGYAALRVSAGAGMLWRVLGLVVATVAGAAVLAWVPRRQLAWTGLGSRTLQGYVLHGFLVRGAIAAGWLAPAVLVSWWAQALLVVGAVALAPALCTAAVDRTLGWLVSPPIGRWLQARADRQ
jgi:fucose 4-O-acetylase-like acetyltransferase